MSAQTHEERLREMAKTGLMAARGCNCDHCKSSRTSLDAGATALAITREIADDMGATAILAKAELCGRDVLDQQEINDLIDVLKAALEKCQRLHARR